MNSLMQYTNGSLIPSPKDLALVLPRLAQRAGAFAFYTVPEQIDGFMGKMRVSGGSMIAERTAAESINATASNTTRAFLQAAPSRGLGGTATATASRASTAAAEAMNDGYWSLQTIRSLGGMFSYFMTRWALGTFLVSVLLNRTQFYASSRTPLRLQWHTRVALYIIPMYMLLMQALQILQATRCQASPHWPEMRYGDAEKHIGMDYAGEGGFLYKVTSALLFWQSEHASCTAVNMTQSGTDKELVHLSGSLALLWPLFLTLCLSQFIETLACALQGRQPVVETGMTIFEHSLAFCEAEAMLIKPWELAGKVMDPNAAYTTQSVDQQLTRTFLKGFMNVPPEVLVICLISTFSHLASNCLAVLDKRKQYRLINTSVWALSYMAAFIWSVWRPVNAPSSGLASPTTAISIGLTRFPTVCIIGFIPHLAILGGITVCACVYALALLITAVSPPETMPQPTSFFNRFTLAYQNLQANVHFSAVTPITVHWYDDFYTSLLKIGFAILTSASEAVYLNEGVPVRVASMTWLEKKRYQELVKKRGLLYKKTIESIPQDLRSGGSIAAGTSSVDATASGSSTVVATGYAVERKSKAKEDENAISNDFDFNDRGVGYVQRHWRLAMAFRFFKGIFWLGACFHAKCIIFVLEKLGIERRPNFLVRLAGSTPTTKAVPTPTGVAASHRNGLQFWMLNDNGSLRLPKDDNVDVEMEMRKRIASSTAFAPNSGDADKDAQLDTQTYNWWKSGGWWGELDSSGDYAVPASEIDDDTTSMISMSTNASYADDDWQSEEGEGTRTPTQSNPFSLHQQVESTNSLSHNDALDPQRLAELLDPQNVEQHNEARMLARHLRNDSGPMTRNRYRRQLDFEHSRILGSSASRQRSRYDTLRSAEEEERELESFIMTRRSSIQGTGEANSGGWQGPACVVCQYNPRTILAWPCGCLSTCDECRIGLATRNYSNCVCCRTGVSAFSRIWVP